MTGKPLDTNGLSIHERNLAYLAAVHRAETDHLFVFYRTLSLIIEIECNGEKQYTTAKDDVLVNADTTDVWNEHLFFELKNLVSSHPLSFLSFNCHLWNLLTKHTLL